jgi:hypothetical protein
VTPQKLGESATRLIVAVFNEFNCAGNAQDGVLFMQVMLKQFDETIL